MNKDEWLNLVPLVVAVVAPIGAKYGFSASDVTAALTGLIGIGFGLYLHWNMKKVPENATIVTTNMGVGGRDPNIMRGLGLAFLIALAMSPGYVREARAEIAHGPDRPTALARSQTPAEFNASSVATPGAPSTQSQAAGALTGVLGDIASYVDSDLDEAIKLSTAVPGLQDGHGQGCWMALKDMSAVIKLHPLPATLKLASDLEAARLVSASLNKVCANPHCNMVFTDLANGIAQIGVGIPLPGLTAVCAKVPTITMVAPDAPAPAAN